MGYLEELQALVEEGELLAERENHLYAERGVPEGIPLVARESDSEVQQMISDRTSHTERMADLFKRYPQGGASPGA